MRGERGRWRREKKGVDFFNFQNFNQLTGKKLGMDLKWRFEAEECKSSVKVKQDNRFASQIFFFADATTATSFAAASTSFFGDIRST